MMYYSSPKYIHAVRELVGGRVAGPKNGPLSVLKFYDGQTLPTEEEIKSKIAELEAAEPMRLLRIERDRRLSAVDWWTSRALDGTALTEAQKSYRQQLRDLPKMITPDDSTEPSPAPTIDENGQLVFDHWPEYNEDK